MSIIPQEATEKEVLFGRIQKFSQSIKSEHFSKSAMVPKKKMFLRFLS